MKKMNLTFDDLKNAKADGDDDAQIPDDETVEVSRSRKSMTITLI